MFADYETVTNFHRLPTADRRQTATASEIRLRVKRTLNRRAA